MTEAVKTARYTDAYIIQSDFPNIGFVNTMQDYAKYQHPNIPLTTPLDATFTNTHHPLESDNVEWKNVEINWTRSTTSSSPIFKAIFELYGIMIDGEPELIGSKEIDTITTSPVTESTYFPLIKSAGEPPIIYDGNTAPSGKIQLDLPMPLSNYSSITYNRVWGDPSWSKRLYASITGVTGVQIINYPKEVTITYDSDMRSDFGDIRFYGDDARTPLNHYLVSKTNGVSAVYRVQIPETALSPMTGQIFVEYGNASAASASNGFNTFTYFDDFEDGKYTSRSSPYKQWTLGYGTPAMETASPINGTYSIKHTGNGSNSIYNGLYGATNAGNSLTYATGFDFKLSSQGIQSGTPAVWLWFIRYDGTNAFILWTYYDSSSGKQMLAISKSESGTWTDLVSGPLYSGKMPVGTKYRFTIQDTGDTITVWINGAQALYTNAAYSTATGHTMNGFGCNGDSAGIWDNIWYYIPTVWPESVPSIGVWSSEQSQSNTNIQPDSWDDNLQYLRFSLPSDHGSDAPVYFNITELGSSIYESPDFYSNSTNTFELGYDHTAKYHALRVVPKIHTDGYNNIQINSINYKYNPNI